MEELTQLMIRYENLMKQAADPKLSAGRADAYRQQAQELERQISLMGQ